MNSPSHADQHGTVNDIVELLEAKVGVNSSAVTTTHDYKLSGVTGTDKAVSRAGTEVLTGKTVNGVVLDATGAATSYLDKTGAYSIPTGASGAMTLLFAATGTDATVAATTVSTYAISGLTNKDTLIIYLSNTTTTAATGAGSIYHVTDAVTLIATSALTTDQAEVAQVTLRQFQNSNLRFAANMTGSGPVSLGSGGTTTGSVSAHPGNMPTAWTGSWTIGLRHGGVTATGLFCYSWSIYKVAGQ